MSADAPQPGSGTQPAASAAAGDRHPAGRHPVGRHPVGRHRGDRRPGDRRPPGWSSIRLARLARRLVLPVSLLLGLAMFLCFGAIRVPPGMDTTPSVPPGSLCLVDRRGGNAQVGSEVFVDLPEGGTLLSRVVAIGADDRLTVQNDNEESRLPDSDQFGALPRSAVRGVVLVVFPGQGEPGEVIRGR